MYTSRKFKNHVVDTEIMENFKSVLRYGRSVPIHLQEREKQEIRKLIRQDHVKKLEKCSDKQVISPKITTVKNVHPIKLALNSKQINKYIHKISINCPT